MHSLTIDPATREGSAIAALFNKIKTDVQSEPGDSWDSAKTTAILVDWFTAQGIDVSDGLITSQTPSGLAPAGAGTGS
ncbi:hypothetical protein ACWEQL_00370 [Kitasatospora sp. NPDC004240]